MQPSVQAIKDGDLTLIDKAMETLKANFLKGATLNIDFRKAQLKALQKALLETED
jgi:acyl-CoA reductase-like NAD-dependent aldehyde dehydrogenase